MIMKKHLKKTLHFFIWPIIGTALAVTFIFLLHSPWMESWLLDRLEGQIRSMGVDLRAEGMSYNLLRGNIEFDQVSINSGDWRLFFERATLNGSYEMFFGERVIDHVNLFGGEVEWVGAAQQALPTGSVTVPGVTIHSMNIEGLEIRIGQYTRDFDVSLGDLRGSYAESMAQFECRIHTSSRYISDQNRLSIRAKTQDFVEFDPLTIQFSDQGTTLKCSGSTGSPKGPVLHLEGIAKPPGSAYELDINANLRAGVVDFKLCGQADGLPDILFEGITDPIFKDSKGTADDFPIEILSKLVLADVVELDIETEIDFEQGLRGRIGGPVLVKDPNLNLVASGTFYADATGVGELVYEVQSEELNTPIDLRGQIDFHSGFSSWHQLQVGPNFVETQIDTSWDMEPQARIGFELNSYVDGLQVAETLGGPVFEPHRLPRFLGSSYGALTVRGSSIQTVVLENLGMRQQIRPSAIVTEPVSFSPLWLSINAQGNAQNVVFECFDELDLYAKGNLNPLNSGIEDFFLVADGYSLATDIGTVKLSGHANANGFLDDLNADGKFTAHLQDDPIRSVPVQSIAEVQGEFQMVDGVFGLTNMLCRTHSGNLKANAAYDLNDPKCWSFDLDVKVEMDPLFKPLFDFELPAFDAHLSASPDGIKTRFAQSERSGETGSESLDGSDPYEWRVPVNLGSLMPFAQWRDSDLIIGGLAISVDQVRVQDGIPLLNGSFSIVDPTLASAVFYNWRFDPLHYTFLDGQFQMDFSPGQCTGFHVLIDHLEGDMFDETLIGQNWSIDLGQGMAFEPLSGEFAGANITILDHFQYASPSPIPSTSENQDLGFQIQFEIEDRERFNHFGRGYLWDLPDIKSLDLGLETFQLGFEWFNDFWDFQFWALIPEGQANYLKQDVRFNDACIYWGKELRLHAETAMLNENPIQVKCEGQITHLDIPFDVTALKRLFPQVNGEGGWRYEADWHYEWDRNLFEGTLLQEEGYLEYAFPRSRLEDFELHYQHDTGIYIIDEMKGSYNNGILIGNGYLSRKLEDNDFNLKAERINLDLTDYQALSSFDLRFHAEENGPVLSGTYSAHEGYVFPVMALTTMIQNLFPQYPQLHLPDPRLRGVALDLHCNSFSPITVDHPLAYLEVLVPDLHFLGNLAEPFLESGEIRFLEGSEINLRNDQFVFKPSHIQFTADHPEDPFFQISLEHMDLGTPKPVQMIGYLSDIMRGDTDTTDFISVIVSYMMGQVSSMINLETESNENVFDTDFALVLSKTLGRRLTTRYVVPLDLDKNQELAVGFGPYSGYVLNYVRDEANQVNFSKTSKFGFPLDKGEEHIRDIRFNHGPELSRSWIRRRWNLKRGDVYTETALRHAKSYLMKELRSEGYLSPIVITSYRERVIEITLEPGELYDLQIQGLEMDQEERKELFRRLASDSESTQTSVVSFLKGLIPEKGYLPGQVEFLIEGSTISIHFKPGPKIQKYAIDLGEAQRVLETMARNRRWVRQFIKSYLAAPTGTRNMLRNMLVAQGYVTPRLGKGQFNSERDVFQLPIKLGPRSKCGGVSLILDGEPLDLEECKELVGQPFQYGIVEKGLELMRSYFEVTQREMASYKVSASFENRQIFIQLTGFSKKDSKFAEYDISGHQRLEERSVSHLIGLKAPFHRTDLVEAQRRLVKGGQFQFVALHTDDQRAIFELHERNRYDIDYGLGWSDELGLGALIQYKDRMLLRGPNDLVARYESNEREDRLVTQFQFRYFHGLPGDLILTLDQFERFNAKGDLVDSTEDQVAFNFREPKETKAIAEFRIPITRWNQVQFGFEWNRYEEDTQTLWFPISSSFDEANITETITSNFQRTLTPLKLSWSYENIDNYLMPRKGMISTFGVEFFHQALGNDESHRGTRLSGNWTGFLGNPRFVLQQRLRFGAFIPVESGDLSLSPDDPVLFHLGGSQTLRGFDRNSIGPKRNKEAIGGQVMFFSSTELTMLTGWYGFGISPFLDGGQVWAELGDVTGSDTQWTAGLGLVIDTNFGYFRLDYVDHLKSDEPEDLRKNWHFRIGRVF